MLIADIGYNESVRKDLFITEIGYNGSVITDEFYSPKRQKKRKITSLYRISLIRDENARYRLVRHKRNRVNIKITSLPVDPRAAPTVRHT